MCGKECLGRVNVLGSLVGSRIVITVPGIRVCKDLSVICTFTSRMIMLVLFVCFFAFPSYISGVHHFLGEIFAYVTVFLIQPLR